MIGKSRRGPFGQRAGDGASPVRKSDWTTPGSAGWTRARKRSAIRFRRSLSPLQERGYKAALLLSPVAPLSVSLMSGFEAPASG